MNVKHPSDNLTTSAEPANDLPHTQDKNHVLRPEAPEFCAPLSPRTRLLPLTHSPEWVLTVHCHELSTSTTHVYCASRLPLGTISYFD